MPRQYTQEQLEQIYQKLPEELQETLFSLETSENIGQVCESYGVGDERVSEIARYAGHVIMGLILPQEFSGVLETDVKLPKTLADAIARDINRLVFYPIKPALEQLHRMEIEVTAKIITPKPEEAETTEEKQEEPKRDDTYREPIE
ncbi:MAG: hypothetical protein HY459_00720 [Parcubacteria group bacterium]|nr:hypothetical protein [Parcubacteria group bacterium]